jgi:predicted DNA-binding transcriptional regulator AlpA
VAVWLSVSVPWLEIGRTKNYGPKYIRLSERRVRYKRSDVLEWLASRTYENTAKYEHGVKGRQRGSRVIAGKTIPPEVAAEIDRRIAAAAGGDEAA